MQTYMKLYINKTTAMVVTSFVLSLCIINEWFFKVTL